MKKSNMAGSDMAVSLGYIPNLSEEEWKEAFQKFDIKKTYKKKPLWQRLMNGHGGLLACDIGMLLVGIGLLPSEYALSGIVLSFWAVSDMKTHFCSY